MKVTFNASCAFSPLTFMGISSNVEGKDLKLYSKEELVSKKKDFEFNKATFYMFYPIRKQISIGMGEKKFNRLGESKESDLPWLISETKDLAPKRVLSHKFSSLVVDKNDQIWTTGQKYGTDHEKYTKIEIKDQKIKDIFLGHKTRFVITESGKCFMQGSSKQFNLPKDESVSAFKEFKLPDDTEEIVHVSCGNHYTVYTTKSGKVWATGRQFLKRLGIDSDIPNPLPNPTNLKVVKSFTSTTKDQ